MLARLWAGHQPTKRVMFDRWIDGIGDRDACRNRKTRIRDGRAVGPEKIRSFQGAAVSLHARQGVPRGLGQKPVDAEVRNRKLRSPDAREAGTHRAASCRSHRTYGVNCYPSTRLRQRIDRRHTNLRRGGLNGTNDDGRLEVG